MSALTLIIFGVILFLAVSAYGVPIIEEYFEYNNNKSSYASRNLVI